MTELLAWSVKKEKVQSLRSNCRRRLIKRTSMNKKQKILVLDDDPDIGTMIKMMLEYKGYRVIVSDRADLAQQALNTGGVDLIIMDMLL